MALPLDVPLLPPARLAALRELTSGLDADEPVRHLTDLASVDPELTSALLRQANSAVSASRTRIDSARSAIIRIGPSEARRCMLAAAARATFDLDRSGIDSEELWRHLVLVASLAEGGASSQAASAFTAGILHDVGRMAMAAQYPDRYRQVIDDARKGIDPTKAELDLFGFTHSVAGGRVARAWRLPDDLTSVVESHHALRAESSLGATVVRARAIAAELGVGDGVVLAARGSESIVEAVSHWTEVVGRDPWARNAMHGSGGMATLMRRLRLSTPPCEEPTVLAGP